MSYTQSLNDVNLEETVKVESVNCDKIIKRRILDLGIIKGTKIKPVFRSPLGDPTAYEVRGSLISLREEEAKNIYVSSL